MFSHAHQSVVTHFRSSRRLSDLDFVANHRMCFSVRHSSAVAQDSEWYGHFGPRQLRSIAILTNTEQVYLTLTACLDIIAINQNNQGPKWLVPDYNTTTSRCI